MSLNLSVKKHDSLHSSLDQLIKGEILEGDNAVLCDICKLKGRALFRWCIKVPPQMLAIQLKRFGYDYDKCRSVKYDDHYKFPWTLDLAPYTADYLAELEGSTAKSKPKQTHSRSSTLPRPDIIPVSIREAVNQESLSDIRAETSGFLDEDTEMTSPELDKHQTTLSASVTVTPPTPQSNYRDSSLSSLSSFGDKPHHLERFDTAESDPFPSPSNLTGGEFTLDNEMFSGIQSCDKGSPASSASKGAFPRTPSGSPPTSPPATLSPQTAAPALAAAVDADNFATPTSSPTTSKRQE